VSVSNTPLWKPDAQQREATQWTDFTRWLAARELIADSSLDSHALWRWSVSHSEQFWEALWQYCDILADRDATGRSYDSVLVGGDRMAPPDLTLGPRWFPGARLNFAEHLLRRRDDHTAIVSWTERGRQTELSYEQLAALVARCAAALRAAGVQPGDRVAGWLPNVPEAVIAMLAASSLGAIWSSCSPDFGVDGVLDRFGQIEPTILIVADSYQYAGKHVDVLSRVQHVTSRLPSLRATWVVSGTDAPANISSVANAAHWHDVLAANENAALVFTRLPFDHPLYILYSSGTTGLPKCIVHGAGGTLLQHLKEHVLHTDLRASDTMFYFTTCGWMMWNWLVSALAVGATIVLYDGAPIPANDPSVLWRMAAQERVSVFGTSAKYLSALEKTGVRPRELEDLSQLRCVLSTGSPLAEPSYDFVYRDIAPQVQLASISGGTDIVSCFALGDPTGAVYRGELQMRGLGMAVDIWSEHGHPVRGEAGELVCTAPFPSMPIAFWNDPDGAKYRAAYFEHFPGVWRHGDWAEITSHDGLIIHGRSDATLNPGGVRIGTAEIYRQVESLPEVLESVVTEHTQTDRSGTEARVALFVRLAPGVALDAPLLARIRSCIRQGTSPHHVPRVIGAVSDIPRTRSGKISELAVREVIHGRAVKNLEALANPEALAAFVGHPALAE
jgi:acetoacetyl-CoA synthetase